MSGSKPPNNLAARMGHWSAHHRKTAIFGWLAFCFVSFALGTAIGLNPLDASNAGVRESGRMDRLLDKEFKTPAGERVLVQSQSLTASDPEFQAVYRDVMARIQKHDTVTNFTSAYADDGLISADRHSALLDFEMTGDPDTAKDRVQPILDATAAAQAAHPSFVIEEFGAASADKQLGQVFTDDLKKAGELSIPITLGILLVAFGSLVAASIPLLLGLTAVIATLGLLAIPSQVLPMDESIGAIVLLIGLAVGVNYSLFYLKREREERAEGRSEEAALQRAAATSRALRPHLGPDGDDRNERDVPHRGSHLQGLRRRDHHRRRVCGARLSHRATGDARLARRSRRATPRPVRQELAAEARGRTFLGRDPDAGSPPPDPDDHPLRRVPDRAVPRCPAAEDRCARRGDVPGIASRGADVQQDADGIPRWPEPGRGRDPGPRRSLARGNGGDRPADLACAFERPDAAADPDRLQQGRDGGGGIRFPLAGSGTDETSNRALQVLRRDVLPNTVGLVPSVQDYGVTGDTAGSKDFNDQMGSRLVWVFAFVIGFAFLLLLITFRSIVIPIKAVILNLLSVGAAYGVLVLVFQHGVGKGLLDFTYTDGVTAFIPMFLFVILFGLSMDYHVFILSRVREGYDAGMTTEDAIAHGVKVTAGVVTSAAIVMVFVFGVFGTLQILFLKQFGVGLAAAVLIDATIIRALLLPASMKLLGEWNWYLPSWLEWLPRLDASEAEAPPEAKPTPVSA